MTTLRDCRLAANGASLWSIRHERVVGSTMDEAAALARAGVTDRTVVVADHQTAGRGRGGRAWRSVPAAALQMTAILTVRATPDRLGVLPLLVGLAVAEAVEERFPGIRTRLKWPNDVLIGDNKLAGILLVNTVRPKTCVVQVGIGLNIATPADALPPHATSLAAQPGVDLIPDSASRTRDDLLRALLSRLEACAEQIERGTSGPVLDRWRSRAALIGERVDLLAPETTLTGRMVGVADGGELILVDDAGDRRLVRVGDIRRGPRPSPQSGEDV